MIRRTHRDRRRGTILPILTLLLVSLLAFVALAIDIGMMVVARTECQLAADAAAMAGARSLTGDPATSNNVAGAAPAATAAAGANRILSQPVAAGQVTVQTGSFTYNTSQQRFVVNIPRDPSDNWNLVKATVSYTGQTTFARVLGVAGYTVQASATAAHRPRDVAVILDFSGSMRFSSLLGLPEFGTRTGSNNPEAAFPTFGHYSAQSTAALQQTATTFDGSGNAFNPTNTSESDAANGNAPAIAGDFYQTVSPTAVAAFSPAPTGYATTPGGDVPPRSNFDKGPAWATDVADYVGSTGKNSTFEAGGYDAFRTTAFQGYTQGPTYWGKTFFFWPPDPRSTWDWRQRFFIDATSGGRVTLNKRLYDSSGNWLAPGSSTYKIDYAAILRWLTASPNPFPTQLRAGRILYYSRIPDGTDSTLNNRFWTQYPLTDQDERFWKNYIDYVLGLRGTGASTYDLITPKTGYGDDYAWGTNQINTGFNASTDGRFMDYTDNPKRGRLHFWFGPMTLIDFLGNYNLWYDYTPYATRYCWMPGTAHEAPSYACKLGIQAALLDIKNNHPNDHLALIMFSSPRQSAGDNVGGRFNRPMSPLGLSYGRMLDSLWFPPYTIDNPGTEIRPFDYANQLEVPRPMGGTCYSMGLMLAYNQFSCNPALQTYNPSPAPPGDAGGLGRKGSQKLVILETDGQPNTTAAATLTNAGPYNSYYNIRYNSSNPSSGEFPTGVSGYANNDPAVTSQIYQVAGQLCALDSASPPGYATARKPVLIHCIAFGPVFATNSPGRASGLATLQQIQYIGSTQSDPSTALPSYKIINGTAQQMQDNLRTAIAKIMQDGVQVVLVQ